MKYIPTSIIYLSGFISTICGLFSSLYFSSNKTLFIWLLFGTLMFGILTGFLYWQNDIWQTEANKKTAAQAENTEKNSNRKEILIHKSPPKKAKITAITLDDKKIKILTFLYNSPNSRVQTIRQSLREDLEATNFHLIELSKLKMVQIGTPRDDYPGEVWALDQEGRRYLIENKLIQK